MFSNVSIVWETLDLDKTYNRTMPFLFNSFRVNHHGDSRLERYQDFFPLGNDHEAITASLDTPMLDFNVGQRSRASNFYAATVSGTVRRSRRGLLSSYLPCSCQ